MDGISRGSYDVGQNIKISITVDRVKPTVNIFAIVNGKWYPTVQNRLPNKNPDGSYSLSVSFQYTVIGEPGSKLEFGYAMQDINNGRTWHERKNVKTVTVKNP